MAAIFWLIAMVVFLMAEAGTVAMVSLWFAVGSLAALIVSLCAGPVWLQIVVFFVVSAVLLALLRPLAKKYLTPKLTRTNADSVIGEEGYVTRDIDNVNASGTVRLGAMEWTARSSDGSVIPAGTRIRADRIEGVKVFVTPVEKSAKV